MKKYPLTIVNGSGEELTFLGIEFENGIECMRVENRVGPGSGPPMHIHHKQHEELTIVEGTMGTQVAGESPKLYTAGDKVVFEAGVGHKFWNAGTRILRCTGRVWPVNNFEFFLTEVYRSSKASKNNRPALMDTAFLLTHFKSEFSMLDIPPFVRNVVLPVAYRFGKMSGAYKKFADVPASI